MYFILINLKLQEKFMNLKKYLLGFSFVIVASSNLQAEVMTDSHQDTDKKVRSLQGFYKSNESGGCPRDLAVSQYGDNQMMILVNDFSDEPLFNFRGYFENSQVNQSSTTKPVRDPLAGFFAGWQTDQVVLQNETLTFMQQERSVIGTLSYQMIISIKPVGESKILARLARKNSAFSAENEVVCQFDLEK